MLQSLIQMLRHSLLLETQLHIIPHIFLLKGAQPLEKSEDLPNTTQEDKADIDYEIMILSPMYIYFGSRVGEC